MICSLNILFNHPVSEATPNSKITGAYCTRQLQGDLPTSLTHNNTQQHTTTLNITRVHKTTNVPVVFMVWYVTILRGATSLRIVP